MAATFLKSEGYEIGQSLIEADRIETAADLIKKTKANKVNLVLPLDVVITNEVSDKGSYQVVTHRQGSERHENCRYRTEDCRVIHRNH